MPRAYIRLDPAFDEHKESYPDGPYAALIACLCLAEQQPERGRFRHERYLRALLGKRGRYLGYLVEHGDLVRLDDGRVYVQGWDEWQEGDWKVGERVARIRARRNGPDNARGNGSRNGRSNGEGNGPRNGSPSDGGRLSAGAGADYSRSAGAGYRATRAPRANGAASAGMPDVRLTAEQLAAWAAFGPEWDDFKRAWLGRGFLWPPAGEPDDDDTSQRGLLWQVLDARPADLPLWVTEAAGTSTREVVERVLELWHDVRDAVPEDAPPLSAGHRSGFGLSPIVGLEPAS